MKRGTTPTLRVKFLTENISGIARIDFLLKQDEVEGQGVQVLKRYPGEDVTFDSDAGVFLIKYTEEETRLFAPNTFIYMDTLPVLSNGNVVATEIERIRVTPTLFAPANFE